MRSGSLDLPSDSHRYQCNKSVDGKRAVRLWYWSHKFSSGRFDTMRKFFDSRRELVSSGPGSGGGGGSSGSSHAGGNFIGRAFTVGRHQVTVEEIIAEGERNWLHRPDDAICFSSFLHACYGCSSSFMCSLHARAKWVTCLNPMPSPQEWWSVVWWIHTYKLEAYCSLSALLWLTPLWAVLWFRNVIQRDGDLPADLI